ncbi:hypothetical protein SDC9_121735 [bioreactor metagenome]|uniref:Uncharacterized protein n=1 Tax=bioreactor metagenome TaxID=1076179 RepID=A0A645CCQ2_9ZZZZ
MSTQFGDDVVVDGPCHRGELVIVVRRQVDREVVGDEPLVAVQQLCLRVQLLGQSGGDLDRFHLAAEGSRENGVHRVLESAFNVVQPAHRASLQPALPSVLDGAAVSVSPDRRRPGRTKLTSDTRSSGRVRTRWC